MHRLLAAVVMVTGAVWFAGCGEGPGPPAATLPVVTLKERTVSGDSIALTFLFTQVERYNWSGKVLKAQLIKADGEPEGQPAVFKGSPAPEFTMKLSIIKIPSNTSVGFVPFWGTSKGGAMTSLDSPRLYDQPGDPNRVTITGTEGQKVSQIVETCTGPDQPAPFNPGRGLELVVVGFKPNAYVLKLWADKGK
jgi:hypothetical protein